MADLERIKKINNALFGQNLDGEWPIIYFQEAKNPGFFITKCIKILSFSESRVKFRCDDLWFLTESEEIRVWGPDSKKLNRHENILDIFECIEANPLISLNNDKLFVTLVESRPLYMSHRNFIAGILRGKEGLKILHDHFQVSSKDLLINIRQSAVERKNTIPRDMEKIKLKRLDVLDLH
ncbi:MAG: hypothetical protein QW783_03500 [Candidatus Micrarchaeia archaeon]